MSTASRGVLGTLTADYLWIRNLQHDSDVTEKLTKLAENPKIDKSENDWDKTCMELADLAAEQTADNALTKIKRGVFP